MTRNEARALVAQLATDFCVDDVKDWLADACSELASGYDDPDTSRELYAAQADLRAVANRGV